MREAVALLGERAEQIAGDEHDAEQNHAFVDHRREPAAQGGRAHRRDGGGIRCVHAAHEPLKIDGACCGDTGIGVAGTKLAALGIGGAIGWEPGWLRRRCAGRVFRDARLRGPARAPSRCD